ncbi:YcxB family protein [Marinospirillum perlucidum]|uniref:YcxB family protein n=1 Tax=Marinospirillum perlucidum TaxID=1982602 RepID=UPI000DF1A6B2|nr:YcxB family protein [Marinospirillum perlucidum]
MQFDYCWNERQYLRAGFYDYLLGAQQGRRRLLLGVVLISLVALLAWKWLDRGFQLVDSVLIILGGVWLLARTRLLLWMFRRSFHRSGQKDLQLHLELTEAALRVQVDDHEPQDYPWSEMERIVQTERGFLIYPGPFWLPLDGLQGEVKASEVAAFLKRQVANYQDKSHYQLKTSI